MAVDFNVIDQLCKDFKYQEAYDAVKKAFEGEKENVEILWRLARSLYFMGDCVETEKSKKHAKIQEGHDMAKKAVELDENCGPANTWFAVTLGSLNPYISSKEKIGNALIIKNAAMKALEINPQDSVAAHTLGVWCMNVASISWVERKVAATLFGTPPESSYDEALKYLQQAHEADGGYKKNNLKMAECYYNLKKYSEAKDWGQKCIALGIQTDRHNSIDAEAKAIMKKC
eukprot:Pgem_evm1s8102